MTISARPFAALYDTSPAPAEDAGPRETRRALLAEASGRAPEIGSATGLDVGPYRAAASSLVVTEPEAAIARRLREWAGSRAERVQAGALREVRRVLAPGGRGALVEHVRATDAGVARGQDRLTAMWRFIARGCHRTRDTAAALRAAGSTLERLERDRTPKALPVVRPHIAGAARPA